MKRISLLFFMAFTYSICAFSTNYSCDVFDGDKKIMTLPGTLPDEGAIGRVNSGQAIDPNTALSYTLCQQAGFKLISTQVSIPGTRSLTSVTKIQQYPDPKCKLQCQPTA